MEAVPRLPMLSFEAKQSHEPTSFSSLKRYIAEFYHEDPESYAKEFHALESLRNSAVRASHDMDGCSTIKRYYCQLHSLVHRFMSHTGDQISLTFAWKELYSGTATTFTDINHEMAAILYNAGALHTQLGAADARTNEEGMKLVCTHFQCAAWIFGHLRDNYKNVDMGDLGRHLMFFMQQLSFAQAHECILEKSLTDNRKAATVSTVASLIVNFYTVALGALTTGGDEGIVYETVGSRTFKEWKRYVKFKIAYLTAILYLYQGQQYEEMQKMGERVTLYQAAFDKLEEAKKESKGMANQEQINEALIFTMDVIEAKRNAAKKENEYIYHEQVPDLATIPPVKVEKKLMMNGIGFNPSDPEYVNNDIFHRLVPMEAHEGSSLYSEEKAALLRHVGAKVEEKDAELNAFVNSLNLDSLQFDNTVKLPQGIVDRCAALHARPNAISDLVSSMSSLAESCSDVESMLQEIRELLEEEDAREKSYQKTMGSRPSGHFSELIREYQKYQEAHNKAGESNETLRKAMGLHVSNLKTLAQPLSEITGVVPVNKEAADESHFAELKHLLTKVNTMKAQRATLVQEFRDGVTADDITGKIVTWEKKLEKLFKKELAKHDKVVSLIEQNLSAQNNILKALTDAYAKCAPQMKALVETKHKREHFFSSLAASYDIYEDLLGKSAKGLEFYRKLQGNVQKLVTRIKAARDVQEEERQQRLKSTNITPSPSHSVSENQSVSVSKNGPKLKDYLKSGTLTLSGGSSTASNVEQTSYIPPAVRPNPLGSENTSTSTCVTTTTSDKFMSQTVVGGYQNIYYQPDPTLQNYAPASSQYQDGGQQYYSQQQQTLSQASQVQSGYTNPIYQSQYYYTTAQGANVSQSSQSGVSDTYTNPVTQTSSSSYQAQQQPAQQYPTYNYYDQQHGFAGASSVNSYSANVQQAAPITTHSTSSIPAGGHMSTCVDPQQSYYNQSNYSYPLTYSATDQQNQMYYQSQPSPAPSHSSDTSVSGMTQQVAAMSLNQGLGQTYSPQTWDGVGYTGQKSTPEVDGANRAQYGYGGNQYEAATSVGQMYGQYTTGMAYDQQQQQQQYPVVSQTQQPQQMVQDQQVTNQYAINGQTQSYASHPGYVYNSMTGEYQYASGYQMDASAMSQYVQNHYTNAGEGGYGQTVASSTFNTTGSTYDTTQYAYPVTQPVTAVAGQISATQVQTSQAVEPVNPEPPAAATAAVADPTPPVTPAKTSNLDLLSGIDFTTPDIPVTPLLQPKVISTSAAATAKEEPVKVEKNVDILSNVLAAEAETSTDKGSLEVLEATPAPKSIPSVFDRKMSGENVSILSQLDSLDQLSETSSVKNEELGNNETILGKYKYAFDDPNVLKWFHKEVERMEKFIEGINIKTLNGSTPLDTKWKELQDLLVKDESKRTITVAKWFYEKNWKNLKEDYVPYDHARVILPTETEDYINASYVRIPADGTVELGPGCPQLILAQTPKATTFKDFWFMVWSQKSQVVVCLHPPTEILDTFWPTQVNSEVTHGDFSVTLLRQFDLSHCLEMSLKVTMVGSDAILSLSLLQMKSPWGKGSCGQILGIAQNVIDTLKRHQAQDGGAGKSWPVVINSLTGADRSGCLSVAITAILATQVRRPVLINVIDAWYRICSQRKGALEDAENLLLSYKLVLSHGHELLNKHGIMTSYQMKTAQTATVEAKEEIIDPLSQLDPLWKLK
ncbi:tyrosine-protein phosphatase non-receptor type 23 isoform X2 [Phlebotomus papatasi]|uniref:tyrosine-protein phosphatase non-receptor type 23 isoform X2 n=1 Tax=Phlebotomus papatasi TaxID=29031 RepID=UPI002483847A|nr:tyrosine-protein phosphatase non-receptor type 23 isoform X2 [Phlebotomus papatasi]